jgi:hypothetical protein
MANGLYGWGYTTLILLRNFHPCYKYQVLSQKQIAEPSHLSCYSEYHQDIELSSENWSSPTANVATTVLCTVYNQNTYKVSSISELVQNSCRLKAIWCAQQRSHQMAHMAVAQTGS